MAGRVSQDAVEVLVDPGSNARVSQAAPEVLINPTSVAGRVSQAAVEVLYLPRLDVAVPSAEVDLTAPPPTVGVGIGVPPAIMVLRGGPVAIPLALRMMPFDVGGIGTWIHTRPFDIQKPPLAFGHQRPFDVGTSIGFVHVDPFDIEGRLRVVHERPFAILSAGDPLVGSDRPVLTPVVGLVLTAPTDGTNVLHVNSTTGVQPGMTAVIGTYTATVIAVTPTTVTLDQVIP